jgi:lipopolysaccharide export system protein LptA
MEIKDGGKVTILKGNSKIISDWNTITAENIIYDRGKSVISSQGDVRFLLNSKNNESEAIEGYGNFIRYNVNEKNGKIWGDTILKLKCFINDSSYPIILCAQEIYVDDNLKILKAHSNVEVMTSYGKICSDNAVFSRKESYAVFEKDKQRPVANVFHGGIRGICEADRMGFYNLYDEKRIIMNGSVEVKIEIKEKKSDTQN